MLTKFNATKLAVLYDMCESNFHGYLQTHRDKLRELATKKVYKGKTIIKQCYNTEQLKYMLEHVFKDTPEGYEFNGKTFVKLNE